uniref:3'-5' exonuclease domain-containing protein n=1 Tax=Panagrolaimus sp. JU765 TaxID=591449 RepID=A0AC34R030_9BILA
MASDAHNTSGNSDDKTSVLSRMHEVRNNVWNIMKENPANLANALYRPLQGFLTDVNTSAAFRQRVFLSVVYLNTLSGPQFEVPPNKVLDIISEFILACPQFEVPPNKVLDIISEFILACANFLNSKDKDFLSKRFEKHIDARLVKDFIGTIVQIKPKSEKFRILESILCLDDPEQEPLKLVTAKLELMIPKSTQLVFSWINFFHLEEFRKEKHKDLALASVIHGLDLQKFLFTDEIAKLETLRYLDSFANDKLNWSNLTPLEKEFIDIIGVIKIRDICYKHSNGSGTDAEKADIIPNTIMGRVVSDLQFQMHKLKGVDLDEMHKLKGVDLDEVLIQSVKSNINSPPFILANIFEMIRKRRKLLAYALCYEFQLDRGLLKIPPFTNLGNERHDVEEYRGYIQSLDRNSDEYVGYTEREGMKINLIDSEEKYYKLLNWLSSLRNEIIAFDVEANFVCQTSNGTQQAVLLQIADQHFNCYLVDIVQLKQKLDFLAWQSFFILFLSKEIRRVGFDVSNDLKFLQASFPHLKKDFVNDQPEFIDLKKLTTMIIDNNELKSKVFRAGIPSTLSLENVVKALLGCQMAKGEQTKNWEKRPLRDEQLVYAARDASMTLTCYLNLRNSVQACLSDDDSKTLLSESRVIVQSTTNTMNPIKLVTKEGKRGFEHHIPIIDDFSNEIMDSDAAYKISEDLLIVVDATLVKAVPLLRRCGYQTFDHRTVLPENARSIEIYDALVKFIKDNIGNGNLYFLSNRFKFDKESFNLALRPRYIKCIQEQTELGILETVMKTTKTVVDTEVARLRCVKCAAKNTNFCVPIEVFRIIGRSMAKFKQYYAAKFGDAGDLDDEKDRSAVYSMKNYEITDQYLIIDEENGKYHRFVIDGTEDTVANEMNEVKNYKAPTNLFDTNAQMVRYCRNCAVFY